MITFKHNFAFGKETVSVEIDFDTLPLVAKEFIINYGIRQYLSDGAAVGKDEAETEELRNELKAARVREREDKLKVGTMSVRGGGTRTTDPVAKIRRELAIEILKPIFKQHDRAWPKGAELTTVIESFWERNADKPKVAKELQERIAKMQKMESMEVDVDDLI